MVAWLRVLCDACLFVYLRLQATESPGKDHEQQAVPPAEVLPVIPAGNPCPNERAAAHTYAWTMMRLNLWSHQVRWKVCLPLIPTRASLPEECSLVLWPIARRLDAFSGAS